MRTIEQLAAEWLQAKRLESQANANRVLIEEEIIKITGKKDEGSKTHDAEGFKVTVTGKQTIKFDWDKWEQVKDKIPANLHPIKMKPTVDEAGIKYLRQNEVEIYALLPVEIVPAKTSITVKAVEV